MTNRQTVGTFLGAVAQQDVSKMRELANTDYIQHNPFVPTGLEPFIGLLPVLKEHGTTAQNVRMLADGNYVFMHNIWKIMAKGRSIELVPVRSMYEMRGILKGANTENYRARFGSLSE